MEKEKLVTSVLSSLSSQIRVEVLKLLNRKETASFTEIMQSLGLNIRTEAGKFAYHLRELTNAELVTGSSYKGYSLTPLGERVVDFIYVLEETALKRSREMFVRTSRYSIENFDRKKIAESLILEAGVPEETAKNIAKEVEERLLKMKVKYLTAPLIREFVNAILIEKGMEDYRHTLTRLGLPVYDVTELIEKNPGRSYRSPEQIHSKSGDAVLEQYMLLKVLPRRVSDAHLSGSIHIPNANYWVLRPNSIQHDLRLAIGGFKPQSSVFPPLLSGKVKDAESAVSRVLNFTQLFHHYISGNQSLDHLNTILSPYFNLLRPEEVKRLARRLIDGLRGISGYGIDAAHSVSIILEINTHRALKEYPAIGPSDKGSYQEYEGSARTLLSAILDILIEGGEGNFPYLSPSVFVRVSPDCLSEEEILLKTHKLSSLWGAPFYINEKPEWQTENVNYDSNLCRLDSSWMHDWELGTLRTGNLDSVCINLPRIAYESKGDDTLLFEKLKETLETCKIALDTKAQVMENRMFRDNVLGALAYASDSEQYYRVQNSTKGISYLGLPEASKFHIGALSEEYKEINKFSAKMLKQIRSYTDMLVKSTSQRWVVTQTPFSYYSSRLARLDLERFGKETVGSDNPDEVYYSTDNTSKKPKSQIQEVLETEGEFHRLLNGGHILTIPLPNINVSAERILEVTKAIAKDSGLGLYAFGRQLTHCLSCQTNHMGSLQKCSTCGASGSQLLSLDSSNGPQRLLENLAPVYREKSPPQWTLDIGQTN
ncbi:MAG: anaerobic ribonucleoside-triphosphate reductase [Promethearchaeati archaeon SRVP18_Atabeyarchaeia-1]